jgi:hypothetical protein
MAELRQTHANREAGRRVGPASVGSTRGEDQVNDLMLAIYTHIV